VPGLFISIQKMNRRKVIKRFCLIVGGGFGVSYTSLKFYQLNKRPDLASLGQYKILIDALVDTIIPATDSPGAKEAGVGDFVIKMVADCSNKKSQNKFISGLSDLADYTNDHFKKKFNECSLAERTKALAYFEKEAEPYPGLMGKVSHRFLGDPFFSTLKKYTVLGYCTSEAGATKALAYDYIPGKYIGTISLAPGQKAWATQ